MKALLEPYLSRDRCKNIFVELVKVPSPQTDLLEAEPQLRRFIETALEPHLRDIGFEAIRYDGMGNLIAEMGSNRNGRSLMLIAHAMNQPPNTMPDPYDGNVVDGAPYGLPGEVVRGKGASEQKSTVAAMLHALEAVRDAKVPINGKLYFICCVSGETGRIEAIQSVVEGEGVRADMAFVYGNHLMLQIGNRGRVDVAITVHGQACHSSRPHEGCNAVTGATEVIHLLNSEISQERSHPQLGRATLTVNGLHSSPRSTHTVQGRVDIHLDQRLLPGDDPDAATEEIRKVAMKVDGMTDPVSGKPYRIEVTQGAYMYPSLVTAESPAVIQLNKAFMAVLGHEPETMYGQSAFDQGYLNHVGISTVNFGSGEQAFAHTDDDIASVERTFDAARVYAWLVADYLSDNA
jgi:acetylornithine deacetylase/succinyl-diaminopimelate desuccinylase-like protein